MSVDRVKFQDILESQLPRYVIEEFPLLPEFLKQYYLSQEIQSGPADLIQNIDQYVKLDVISNLSNSTILKTDVSYTDTTIETSVDGNFTEGFPDTNGLIQIDDEIIMYETRTEKTFTGCVRGFSGITTYISSNDPDQLVFSETEADVHDKGATIKNLNVMFLQEFLEKIKAQVAPGFSDRDLSPGVDVKNFISNANTFYNSKGTDSAFRILFKALYGVNVDVLHPSEFLIRPSDADYRVSQDYIVESITGNPMDLLNLTMFQTNTNARGSVSLVQPIQYDQGQFYQLSIDIGYGRDIDVKGTIFSEFYVNNKTKVLNDVGIGQTYIDVDSTINFPEIGNLITKDVDGNEINLTYSGKSINQFFDVVGTDAVIPDKADIRDDQYAYGILNNEEIKVRMTASLKDLEIYDDTHTFNEGDEIRLQTLGKISDSKRATGWIINIKTKLDIKGVNEVDVSEKIYEITTFDNHFYFPGYDLIVYDNIGPSAKGSVTRITDENRFVVKLDNFINVNTQKSVENQILRGRSSSYPQLSNFIANVQNTYLNKSNEALVASNSIPNYQDIETNPYLRDITFSGSAEGDLLKLTDNKDHGLYTGDTVLYTPGITETIEYTADGVPVTVETISSFDDLDPFVYYVYRVDEEYIKLARSKSDIFVRKFITLLGEVENNRFTYFNFSGKILEPQQIIRSIDEVNKEAGEYKTEPGFFNGVLVNGVEILNFKSKDKIFYGEVKGIDIGNGGQDYDVTNPPALHIIDEYDGTSIAGVGATGTVSVTGNLQSIDVIDPGFDYIEQPFVSITGGNGKESAASASMIKIDHVAQFNSETDDSITGNVNLTNNTIGFATYHKFRDNEVIVYDSKKLTGVGGLTTGAQYHVSVVDGFNIQLHKTFDDSNLGINTISLTSFGSGVQEIRSTIKKSIVSNIIVTNPGSLYKNNRRKVISSGINTSIDTINIVGHQYLSGDQIMYTPGTEVIGGLNSTSKYYVTKLDDDNFKLSPTGVAGTASDFYYREGKFVNIESVGNGSFNYEPIKVEVQGVIGVSTLSGQDFNSKVQGIFRGSVEGIDITNGGVGYGASEIINFKRDPFVSLRSGADANLLPIISNGKVVDVIVVDGGYGYNSPPTIVVESDTGKYCRLVAVTNGDNIIEIKIQNQGVGYITNETNLRVIQAGRNAIVEPIIQTWTIDNFARDFNNISDDDGFVTTNLADDSLQYCHVYAPRALRRSVTSLKGDGTPNYGSLDLETEKGVEVNKDDHSPILGWAYDGNPIYGPYGFKNGQKGLISQMRSGYEIVVTPETQNRPPASFYPGGFFSEDYRFAGIGDLDKHNGRFCATPDFPNGVYAYFATFTEGNDSSGPFEDNKRPYYPYMVGPSFRYKPNTKNYQTTSNQTDYDFSNDEWFRNTTAYHIGDDKSDYEYVFYSNDEIPQSLTIESVSRGGVESVGIITGGRNYKRGDKVIFNDDSTGGYGASAKVRTIAGRGVTSVTADVQSVEGVEFISDFSQNSFLGFSSSPHNLKDKAVVSIDGLSQYYKGFEGTYTLGIRSDNFVMTLGIQTSSVTGVCTYFYVDGGNLKYPYIRPNDILQVSGEKVKVLDIDVRSERLKVLRGYDGTPAIAHSSGEVLYEITRKFRFNSSGISSFRKLVVNEEYYFDSPESVGIGTTTGLGVGTTVSLNNPGVGVTEVFLTPQSIRIPKHGLSLNDKVIYRPNGGTPIQTWNGVSGVPYRNLSVYDDLFVAPISEDFIGIASNRIGMTSTGYVGVNSAPGLLYFTSAGTGMYQSFFTDLEQVLTGDVNRSVVTVGLAQTHNLQEGDTVNLDVNPIDTVTIVVKYDDYNRRMVFDPKTFSGSDVDISKDTITFTKHNYIKGDKVILTTTSAPGGLLDERMYFVLPFSKDKIRLVNDISEIDEVSPKFVNITSIGNGTLSKINPQFRVNKNNLLKFDLSDESLSFISNENRYSAFDMALYSDSEYEEQFSSSQKTTEFEVVKTGEAGIGADASLSILITDDVPTNLWYNFNLKNIHIITKLKKEYVVDSEVVVNNSINVVPNEYDGTYRVSGITSMTYTFDLPETPNKSSYDLSDSVIKYDAISSVETGPISEIIIDNSGFSYEVIPGITSVRTDTGEGAILQSGSGSIGKVLTTKFKSNKIGFDYPSDNTLKVVSNLPEIVEVDALLSFDYIGITSAGNNYVIEPDLIAIDGFTNERVENIDIRYKLGDNQVTIYENTYGLSDTEPRIVPINNSNGVGIVSAYYEGSPSQGYLVLSPVYETEDDIPFSVGDKVYVENVNIGVNSTGTGYNSEDYGYIYFDVQSITKLPFIDRPNAVIGYNLFERIEPGMVPGNILKDSKYGRIIKKGDLATFNSVLRRNNYLIGETVLSNGSKGKVESWNPIINTAKISTPKEYKVGDKLVGKTSNTISYIRAKTNFDSEVITGLGVTIISGWQKNTGFLNNSLQRIPNNEYYQNFSYSLSSPIPYQTWDDPVSALNHTAGFQKFSDLQVISMEDNFRKIQPIQSFVDTKIDIISESSIHSFYDFDDVGEVATADGGNLISNEVYYQNRRLLDHFEAIGNRVLNIDDFSSQFNSNERIDDYVEIGKFDVNMIFNKSLCYVKDTVFTDKRQVSILSFLQNGAQMWQNEYGRLKIAEDLGDFDYVNKSDGWSIRFFPVLSEYNSYEVSILNTGIFNNIDAGFGTEAFSPPESDINFFTGAQVDVPQGTPTTVVSFGTTYRSAKIRSFMATPTTGFYEGVELNIIHNDTDVFMIEYNNIETTPQDRPYYTSGLGTWGAYINGGLIDVNFYPYDSVGTGLTCNLSANLITAGGVGVGSTAMRVNRIIGDYHSIPASASPTERVITSYTAPYEAGYYQIQVSDTTNNVHSFGEFVVLNSDEEDLMTDFGEVNTDGPYQAGIGSFSIFFDDPNTQIRFLPQPDRDIEVRVFGVEVQIFDENEYKGSDEYANTSTESLAAFYAGTKLETENNFELKHNEVDIFTRYFFGDDEGTVIVDQNKIMIPNHYFESGQHVKYSQIQTRSENTANNIGIAATVVPGIGLTDKLPEDLYVIRLGAEALRFAATAEDALAYPNPRPLTIDSVGLGTFHIIKSQKSNTRALMCLDNMIQNPIMNVDVNTSLREGIGGNTLFQVAGITSFFSNDFILIDDELMIVLSAYQDPTDNNYYMSVVRGQMGTTLATHASGTNVQKVVGSFNIVDNRVFFAKSPYGLIPLSTDRYGPSEIDWTGVTTHSTFQGRTFNRTSPINSVDENYRDNFVFDDISTQFTGITSSFRLFSDFKDVAGFSTFNSFVTINGIMQYANGIQENDKFSYDMSEAPGISTTGITTITFQGDPYVRPSDPNTSEYPLGGLIQEIATNKGFGYQPTVAAGATATVSGSGEITAITIGNSGSGYRPGVQPVVNVGVQTYSDGTPNIEFIGTASISDGRIVSIAITNPGSGYSQDNPPEVVIDEPFPYENIPLIYSASSPVGYGTGATANIQVGNGSSIKNMDFVTYGTGYGSQQILTVAIGGTVGIPTDPTVTFEEYQILIKRFDQDKFGGYYNGELEFFDDLDSQFDGEEKVFKLTRGEIPTAVVARKGSEIDVDQLILVFINNILQNPANSYTIFGGSRIEFTEAPKPGDTSKIVFYKGTPGLDVRFVDVIDTVKAGDTIQIYPNYQRGQDDGLLQEERIVIDVPVVDESDTNPYSSSRGGITTDKTLKRPLVWTRQTTDSIIDGKVVGKSRRNYEPLIYPYSYLIADVGLTTTVAFVQNIRTIFNASNELPGGDEISAEYQNIIAIVSQDEVAPAFGTAIVSTAGTISSVDVTSTGIGYTVDPTVSFGLSGTGSTTDRAEGTYAGGVVTITKPGSGYDQSNPPQVIFEFPNYPNEKIDLTELNGWEGDYGTVVSINSVSGTELQFDLFIDIDSDLRDGNIAGTGSAGIGSTSISGLAKDYYFTVSNSNPSLSTGDMITKSSDGGSDVGVCTSFLDGVYQVSDTSVQTVSVPGVGNTSVLRVNVKVGSQPFVSGAFSGETGDYGQFSWGKVNMLGRVNAQPFTAHTDNGVAGLTTSPYVRRFNPLKFDGYETI